MPIPAEPWQTAAACQMPSAWGRPARGLAQPLEYQKYCKWLTDSPPHIPHQGCLGGQQGTPQCLASCGHSELPCWSQVRVGQRAVLQEAVSSGALNFTSGPESVSPGWGRGVGGGRDEARVGVEGPFSPSGEAPFSWRDIKTHTKRFHVVPALGLCPSRWINPGAARTDMSSQLCFHVCPQFQCHHTKSRLIVNRPPPLPLVPLPSPLRLPLHIWIPQPFPEARETCSGYEPFESNLISLPFSSLLNIETAMFFSFLCH